MSRSLPVSILLGLLLLAACAGDPSPHAPPPTSIATATATPLPIRTATLTATRAPTNTNTPASPSATATRTPTVTRALTITPSATCTSTATRSFLIGIDPGHGGKDLGARHFDKTGHMDFYESQITLAIALRLAELLRANGYAVVLTREGDYYVNQAGEDVNEDGEVNFLDDLQKRVDIINAAGADLLLSIHLNAYEQKDGASEDIGGTTTYYCKEREFSDRNLLFARLVHEHVLAALARKGYSSRDRGVMPDRVLEEPGQPGRHLVLLGPCLERCVRPSKMPGALSESLFITNGKEAELLRRDDVLDALAGAYLAAITEYVAEVRSFESGG